MSYLLADPPPPCNAAVQRARLNLAVLSPVPSDTAALPQDAFPVPLAVTEAAVDAVASRKAGGVVGTRQVGLVDDGHRACIDGYEMYRLIKFLRRVINN